MATTTSVRAELVEAPYFFSEAKKSGPSTSSGRPDGWRADAGLTLVEMLVVLAIIGVAAGAVTLGIGAATRAPSVESEARRFAGRLQAAADDAMLGDRMIALTTDESGYGFARVASDGMIPSGTPTIDYHRLPAGIDMRLSTAPPFVLGIDGATRPLIATIVGGRQQWIVRYDGLTATAAPAGTKRA